jgi:nucleoside-diphosphate-sugar epimerase
MRIFVAGASGVIGRELLPLLVARGHEVTGTTRTPAKVPLLESLGATPVVCDVYDRDALRAAVVAARPEVVIHELTDLPDVYDAGRLESNARIRREGTPNLVEATLAAGATRMLAQSTAFPAGVATDALERLVTRTPGLDGVVLRYGLFYGPGTYYPDELPEGPRVSLQRAAEQTVEALAWPPGIYEVVDPS